MEDGFVDLDGLALRSGQAAQLELLLRPPDPIVGRRELPINGGTVEARIDVSRTSSGYAMRLTAAPVLGGPCARCLEAAVVTPEIDAREVEQPSATDEDLTSPYVEDGFLNATHWLHDAITLTLPEKVLCRPDCAGICDECGALLNDFGPGEHSHAKPLDPRFAKLRELDLEGD